MLLSSPANSHLTYCTNIHAGESWREVRRNLETHGLAIKARVAPDRRFGVGLRLSGAAALTLAEPEELAEFSEFLQRNQLYVFTINGFPHGAFHATRVKEAVYRPDWLEPERLAYSDRLARLLAALLPREAGLEGSVSTVPGCFAPRCGSERDREQLAEQLLRHAATLAQIAARGGPTLALAIEPEPECVWQTTGEVIEFFQRYLFARKAVTRLAELTGLGAAASEAALRRHLGVCFDTCHAAVEFEDAESSLAALAAAGVRVAKVQLSSGLVVPRPTRDALHAHVEMISSNNPGRDSKFLGLGRLL